MQPIDNDPESTSFRLPELPDHERVAADHDEPWQYQPYHLSERTKLYLLKHRDRLLASELDAA
ncbi:MAG: hypothetical protein HY329_13015 [Chloroflexi bacterium]|nr:hypothetical protein [Chloroflexota bacterium]